MFVEGIIMLEIKFGYGFIFVDESKQLCVVCILGQWCVVEIVLIFFGVYVILLGSIVQVYIDEVCGMMIFVIVVEGLVEVVDVFCEIIVFSVEQVEQVFLVVKCYGMVIKIYVEQFSNQYGVVLVVCYGVLLVDYIEYFDVDGIVVMVVVGIVVVLLLGVFYFICDIILFLIVVLCVVGVLLVLVIDFNFGMLLFISLLLVMNMVVMLFCMIVEECIVGFIWEVVCVFGCVDCIGCLVVGLDCNLVLWDIDVFVDLVYCMGFNLLYVCVMCGVFV